MSPSARRKKRGGCRGQEQKRMRQYSRRLVLAGASSLLALAPQLAHAATRGSAAAVLDHELAAAAAEHRGVLLVFFASWCPYCHLLDQLLASEAAQRIVASRFAILNLRVRERRQPWIGQQLAGAHDV